MEKFRVGIIGATGMVGQRFVLLTANHPWFTPVVLAASTHSAGKTYAQAIGDMADPIPESVKSMIVMDAEADAEEIANNPRSASVRLRAVELTRPIPARWRKRFDQGADYASMTRQGRRD